MPLAPSWQDSEAERRTGDGEWCFRRSTHGDRKGLRAVTEERELSEVVREAVDRYLGAGR